MARKPNYDFEKRRKELDRKAKKEAKAQRKLENASNPDDESAVPAAAADEAETARQPE